MENYKVDIRFVILSVLVHIGIFALLMTLAKSTPPSGQAPVAITLQDNNNNQRMIIVPQLAKPKPPIQDNKQVHSLSDQQQRFEKEVVARNNGITQNEEPKKQIQQKNIEQQTAQETEAGPTLLPIMPTHASQQERRSSVDFEAPNVSKGDVTFLNSDFYTYASFYNRISPQIVYHWSRNIEEVAAFPHIRERLLSRYRWTTTVELILNNKGYYINTIVMSSSGSVEMDQAVVTALQKATPFLNPPSGMVESDGNVHVQGEFTVYTQRPRMAN